MTLVLPDLNQSGICAIIVDIALDYLLLKSALSLLKHSAQISVGLIYVLNDIVGALNTTRYVSNSQVGSVVMPNITKSHFHYFKKAATFVLRYLYKCFKI